MRPLIKSPQSILNVECSCSRESCYGQGLEYGRPSRVFLVEAQRPVPAMRKRLFACTGPQVAIAKALMCHILFESCQRSALPPPIWAPMDSTVARRPRCAAHRNRHPMASTPSNGRQPSQPRRLLRMRATVVIIRPTTSLQPHGRHLAGSMQ